MWRQRALCNHCGQATRWQRDLEAMMEDLVVHLREAHHLAVSREPQDYQVTRERQCDYCLEPYVDHCTKCGQDFCHLHAGDIDGLCGGCI